MPFNLKTESQVISESILNHLTIQNYLPDNLNLIWQ